MGGLQPATSGLGLHQVGKDDMGDLKFDEFCLECKHVLHCFNPNTNQL